jgi:sugar lactone lactonase YvrE
MMFVCRGSMKCCRVLAGGRVWLAGFAAFVGLGVWTGSARAVTYVQTTVPISGLHQPFGVAVDGGGDVFVADSPSGRVLELPAGGSQQTLPFSGLSDPEGVAVDGAGDVFVADAANGRVVELPAGGTQQTLPSSGLSNPQAVAVDGTGDVFVADTSNGRVVEPPAGGSQQTLPFSGLSAPTGVAVDLAGDVFVADRSLGRVFELSPSVTSRSFVLSPATGPAGSSIGLASVTSCKLFSGGAFAATEAKLFLYSSTGQLLEHTTVDFGDQGSWAGSLPIPVDAASGTTYIVRARCTDSEGVMAQAYRSATFTVQGPTTGLLGGTRSTGPKLIGEKSKCRRTTEARSSRSCIYTFTYVVATAKNRPAIAIAVVNGHRRVIARGRIRHRKLTLVFRHLGRGRHKLTLLAVAAHGKRTVIGHTTVAVS